jgi:hypothetical protein
MRIASLRVGSLVRMVDDPHHILGLVVEIRGGNIIKVNWLDEMCDPTFVNQWDLEIICK